MAENDQEKIRADIEFEKERIRKAEKWTHSDYKKYVRMEAQLEILLEKILRDVDFKTSNPPIDLEFLRSIATHHGSDNLREQLNHMKDWLRADPQRKKKNYRRFIQHWMKNEMRPYQAPQGKADY